MENAVSSSASPVKDDDDIVNIQETETADPSPIGMAEPDIPLEEEEEEEKKTEKPPEYVDDGGEKTRQEIQEEKIVQNRNLIHIRYSRKRRNFGKPMQHTIVNAADTYYFFPSFTDPKFVTLRRERDVGVQNATESASVHVQTTWNRLVNSSTQANALESLTEEELKMQINPNDTKVLTFLKINAPIIEEALEQNTTLQLFNDDFEHLANEEAIIGRKSDSQLKEQQSFTHIEYSKSKRITAVDWQPKARGVIAFTCVDPRSFNERMASSGKILTSYVVIWNFSDPIYPQMVLEAPYDVLCMKFNPTKPNIIVGGMVNGQVIMWDLEQYKPPLILAGFEDDKKRDQIPHLKWQQASFVEQSHKFSVNDLHWLPDGKEVASDGKLKDGGDVTYQFASIACDGRVHIWDIRIDNVRRVTQKKKNEKLKDAWIPYMSLNILHLDGTKEIFGNAFVLGDKETNPYHIIVASQEGEFVISDWTPVERKEGDEQPMIPVKTSNNTVKEVLGVDNGGHVGVITSLQRHPFIHDIYLTVGDWSFKIWKVGVKKPIWSSPFRDIPLMCGKWSPTRPSVIFIGRKDGGIEVWDFQDKSHECSMENKPSTQAGITSFEFRVGTGSSKYNYQFIAAGSEVGTLFVLEVPRSLIRPLPEELHFIISFFNREAERVDYYTKRWQIHAESFEELKRKREIEEFEKGTVAHTEPEEDIDVKSLMENFEKRIRENVEPLLLEEQK